MQYLISFCQNLKSENFYLKASLQFKDQNVEKNYKNFQRELNKGTMILIETFKVVLELAYAISSIIQDFGTLQSHILFLFPISSIIQVWIIVKNHKCNDYWKIGHVIILHLYLALYKEQFLLRGFISLYNMYITQSLFEKKYLICYYLAMQVTYQYFDKFLDYLILPCQWILAITISFCIYYRERSKLVQFFQKFNFNHDLSYQEAILNHSLQQNLFVIKLSPDLQNRPVDYFEVLFANQACKKEFATAENIYSRTTSINVVNCNDSNLSYYNLKVNFSYEQIYNFRGSTGEQINIMDKPIYLNQILYQYILNFTSQEMQENLPLKLTGLQSDQQFHQTFDILVSPCIWKFQKCFIVSLIDITDRIKISHLEKLDQYKDNVLATVSHDLKNPISVIDSMLKIVQDGLNEIAIQNITLDIQEKIQSCCNSLQMCQTNIQILQSFVNDLQDFAQIKQQKLKLSISRFEISQLIQEIKSVFSIQLQKKNLELEITQNLISTQYCNNDPLRIKQVLFNLISNALKFTSQGQIQIKFSDELKDVLKFCKAVKEQIECNKSVIDVVPLFKNKSRILICTVSDNGTGMTQEVQRGLFRNFATYDVDNHNKNGVGLGLIICKQLCGYIGPLQYMYLKSQVGVGSTFQFAIYKNYDKQNHCDYSGDQSSIDSIDYDISVHSPYKNLFSTHHLTPLCKKLQRRELVQVLIVDDETFNNILLKMLLNKIGIQLIDMAFNGHDAIEMSKKKDYDVVFLDVSMPGIDGIECLKSIKKTLKNETKFYMLTAFSDIETQQFCLNAGADKILHKPVSIKEIELLFN